MTPGQKRKVVGATAAFTGVVLAGMFLTSPRGRAQDRGDGADSRIEQGFDIAPVPLNLDGKNKSLVGLGSYIVNAQSGCNGCHSQGPQTEYLAPGNPYLLPPPNGPFLGKQQVNPATYLGGGRDFGPFPGLQHLYSRNLTPDKTGRPEAGHTYEQFLTILRTGQHYNHIHPTSTVPPNAPVVPAPFNGDLLLVMPWPEYQNLTDRDIRAIYEYLSAIPCIDTNIPGAPVLRNDCQ